LLPWSDNSKTSARKQNRHQLMLHLSLKGQKRALYFVKRLQERFTDFDKLDLVKFAWWLFDFRHEPISDTAPAVSKNDARFKNGQKIFENNYLIMLV